MSQVNQVEFTITFLWARLSVLVTEQSRSYVYAFQLEAPTEEIWETSINNYISLEIQIQECFQELSQIKDSFK